jgi:hypothetical protein
VLEACGQPQPNDSNKFVYGLTRANEAACDPRPLPATVAPQPQKRGREEYHSNLLEDGDSAKKIKKTENDTPLTQTSSETRASKGSKRKATAAKLKTKAKTKIEGEQAMAHLQEQSHWSDEDTKLLLETLLGGDSEFYEGLTGNAKHIFKKVTKMQSRLASITANTIPYRSPNAYSKDGAAQSQSRDVTNTYDECFHIF